MVKVLSRSLLVALVLSLSLALGRWINTPAPPDPPQLYSHQLGLHLSHAIRRAQRSVHLTIFALTDDHILSELAHAKARGCHVTVIHDSDQFCPFPGAIPRELDGLMHRKILVIDEHLVWLGSANMTTPSLRGHDNLMLALDSQTLAHALIHESPGPTPFDQGELWLLPQAGALERLCTLLDSAETSLQIAMFTWTHPKLLAKVVAAHRRGVNVEVALDNLTSQGASKKTYAQLRAAGIPVRIGSGRHLLHHKYVLIDDEILVLGSANWTKSAFTRNQDCLLILTPLTDRNRKALRNAWRRIG